MRFCWFGAALSSFPVELFIDYVAAVSSYRCQLHNNPQRFHCLVVSLLHNDNLTAQNLEQFPSLKKKKKKTVGRFSVYIIVINQQSSPCYTEKRLFILGLRR